MFPEVGHSSSESQSESAPHRTRRLQSRIISLFLLVVTLISFVVAWPARDHELVYRLSKVSDDKPAELYIEELFCIVLTDCFRAAHKIALAAIRLPVNVAIDLLYSVPGNTVTEVPGWAPQYVRNLGPYLVLRALLLIAIAFALNRYFRRWWTVTLVANVLLWWSTGAPIRAAVRLYGNLVGVFGDSNLGSWLFYHFSMNSTIFLLEYDYVALMLLLFFPLWLQSRNVHQGVWRPLVLGLALAMSFEHLAPVYVVALLWLAWRKRWTGWFKPAFLVSTGWLLYIIAMILSARLRVPGAEERLVTITQLGYRINREGDAEWIILRFVFGFLGIPYVLGLVSGYLMSKFGLLAAAARDLRPYIHAVLLGLSLSYFVGFFHSALITEFGRQTLAAQVLLFISGALRHSPSPLALGTISSRS